MPGVRASLRLLGSSIATPAAGPWVTDFLNAAFYARAADERDADDLRLAFCILTTRWQARGARRRLGLRDLSAFHRAFGVERFAAGGQLHRESLLAGASVLLGDWFADAYADPSRRAHGIAFASVAAREAFDPARRIRHSSLGPLTPPTAVPGEGHLRSYAPVPLPDPDAALRLLAEPARWPDMGCARGRFTALSRGGLLGQTFEIELDVGPLEKLPVFTRAYVTCTGFHQAGPALDRLVAMLAGELPELATAGEAVACVELTTHEGHPLGAAISRLLVTRRDGAASVRDIGAWDPLPWHLQQAYDHGGAEAQAEFWEPAPAEASMLAQLARVTAAGVPTA